MNHIPGASVSAGETRNQFLNLLVTQLRHQDPLEPVNQYDFLSQLAQFSTLEGIETLNTRFEDLLKLQELTQGSALLGKTAAYLPPGGGTAMQSGVVRAVRVEGGQLQLLINGQSVPLDRVQALTVGR